MRRVIHLVTGNLGFLSRGIKCTREGNQVHQVTQSWSERNKGTYNVDTGYPNINLHRLLKKRRVK